MINSSSWVPDSQIEYFKGSRCGFENCKSKRYYIEEGFTYCQDGHQQDIVRTSSNSNIFCGEDLLLLDSELMLDTHLSTRALRLMRMTRISIFSRASRNARRKALKKKLIKDV